MEKVQVDRYEFANAVIGWAGDSESYKEILKCSDEELNTLVQDESEEFEEQLAAKLSVMTIDELNELSNRFDMKYEVV